MPEAEYAGHISVYYWDSWHNMVLLEEFIVIWSWHSVLINSVNIRLSNAITNTIYGGTCKRCSTSITNFAPNCFHYEAFTKLKLLRYLPLRKVYLFIASPNSSVFNWVMDKYFRFVHRLHGKCSLKRENIVKPWLSESNHSGIMYVSSTWATVIVGFVMLEAWQKSLIWNNRRCSASMFVNIQ